VYVEEYGPVCWAYRAGDAIIAATAVENALPPDERERQALPPPSTSWIWSSFGPECLDFDWGFLEPSATWRAVPIGARLFALVMLSACCRAAEQALANAPSPCPSLPATELPAPAGLTGQKRSFQGRKLRRDPLGVS